MTQVADPIPGRVRAGWRPGAGIAALVGAALLAAACAPVQETDCDQLLADRKYAKVIKTCDDPSALGMAYLGLAGFDFIDFLAADDPNDIAGLLELDESNVSLKRELINQAIRTLVPADSSKQAFILLLASFLGLSVTNSEFLDNGAGGADAFDNDISGEEVEAATGLVVEDPAPAVPFGLDSSATYAVVTGGAPYVADCGTDDVPAGVVPYCDTLAQLESRADTGAEDGAGLTDPALGSALAVADVTAATSANRIVMLLGLDLPITYDVDKLERLNSFLGVGTLDEDFPAENPELFPIGVLGFLELTEYANLKLIEFAGGGTEGGEMPESTLGTAIDDIRARLDNGAACFKESATDPLKIAAAVPLDILYAVYLAAPGTEQADVPGDLDFSTYNIVPHSELDSNSDNLTDDVGAFAVPNGADYEFGDQLLLEMGYKVLHPTVVPLGSFDRNFATPRVDETPSAYRTDFEFLPHLAPGAAASLDGTVEMVEVICSADDA
jgi:hypothetical protein